MSGCARACAKKAGCEYFIYGKGSKHGWCYFEHTSASSCPEGWESDLYDFAGLNTFTTIKKNHECKSKDKYLGKFATMKQCANVCGKTSGCRYFVYGKGSKAGYCYQEFTKSVSCPEGWEADKYDFAQLHPTRYAILKRDHECNSKDKRLGKFA